jgi:Zinc dependent phospholipase C
MVMQCSHAARMNTRRTVLLWSVPAVLFAGDALAWGLYTHVYFAQLLVWAVPLLDPALRRAVKRFPQRLMAGACLPDLALVGVTARTRAFDASHRWETAHALLDAARDDETRACAVGAISHLWVDIIAHNHFVPAHEHLWWNVPMLTHAASEWAMDRHIARHLFRPPATLLQVDDWLVDYVACNFACTHAASRRAIRQLAGAERLLRHSHLPNVLHGMGRVLDRNLAARFDYYIQEVTIRLPQMNRVLAGEVPAWLADCPPSAVARERIAAHAPERVACRMPLPGDLFEAEPALKLRRAA